MAAQFRLRLAGTAPGLRCKPPEADIAKGLLPNQVQTVPSWGIWFVIATQDVWHEFNSTGCELKGHDKGRSRSSVSLTSNS